MGSIEEALKTAGAKDDLQTILRVLEDKSVGFKRHEAAAGPFANMDTTMLTGLNVRMLSVIKRAQQQQHQGWPHLVIHAACLDHLVHDLCMFCAVTLVMREVYFLHQS